MAGQPNAEAAQHGLFTDVAAEMLAMLRDRLGFRLWIVGRLKGEHWLVSHVEGQAYGIRPGHRFAWTDTFCSRMASGIAPRFAPDARDVPQYASAPLSAEFRIGSYLGVPLAGPDGRVLGSLCALDPEPHAGLAAGDEEMVGACARVLARILQAEFRATRQSRRLDRAEAVAFCDALTGLYNRRGWDQLIKAEESRCRRHGRPACVLSIDLDGLKVANDTGGHEMGDDLIRAAADAVRRTIREQDIAARVGGDEFAVVAVECSPEAGTVLRARLEAAFVKAGVSASIGVARRTATSDLLQTWRQADAAMYEAKRERKATPEAGSLLSPA